MNETLKEISDWSCDYKIPNHTYFLNRAGKLVAYIKEGTDDIIHLKKFYYLYNHFLISSYLLIFFIVILKIYKQKTIALELIICFNV